MRALAQATRRRSERARLSCAGMRPHGERARRPIVVTLLTAASMLLLAAPGGASEGSYVTRSLCASPAPGHASCLGLRLTPAPASGAPAAGALLRRATGGRGGLRAGASPLAPDIAPQTSGGSTTPVTPADLHAAYRLPSEPLAGSPAQTIALVDAYDDPTAEADLATFDEYFGLPGCTSANGCFAKVNQSGERSPLPKVEGGWAAEIATDVETAHAICETCHILLVEARSTSYSDLQAAESAAWRLGATEISNSWGGEEPSSDSSVFDHPGTVITASAGDAGYLNWKEPEFSGADYPASSPHVVAVGGTSLHVDSEGSWLSESVWNDSAGATGGGCSGAFSAPSWQRSVAGWAAVGCGSHRAVSDVSADADPYTGVYVYDSTPEAEGSQAEGWMLIGGTSVASPMIAATFALAGGAHGVEYPAATLYSHLGGGSLHDVTTGGSGKCDGVYTGGCSGSSSSSTDCGSGALVCNAASGYDGPTGVGTPNGLGAFEPGGESPPGEQIATEEPEAAPTPIAGASPTSEETVHQSPSAGGTGSESSLGGESSVGGAGSAKSSAGPSGEGPGSSPGARTPPALISKLRLTRSARFAIAARRLSVSRLSFSFRSSARARVRFVLSIRVRIKERSVWLVIRRRLGVWAHAGANLGHLPGGERLPPGVYELFVGRPGATGRPRTARSLQFKIRR